MCGVNEEIVTQTLNQHQQLNVLGQIQENVNLMPVILVVNFQHGYVKVVVNGKKTDLCSC